MHRIEVEQAVVEEVRRRLVEARNSLADDASLDAGLEVQIISILRETVIVVSAGGGPVPAVAVDYSDPQALTKHGHSSAIRDIDPAEPLMAAEILFDVALSHLVDALTVADVDVGSIDIARSLHHAIWRRFPPGAIAYVAAMRNRLAVAHQEGRLRVARELHDTVAQDVLAAAQQVELLAGSTPRDKERLEIASAQLRRALSRVQALSLDLRHTNIGRSLQDSLAAYIGDLATLAGAPVRFHDTGRPRVLSAATNDELYAIAVEAIRNARNHAEDASEIDVRLTWTNDLLTLEIVDDGGGVKARRPGALGLIGMHERAREIGGELDILSSPAGTAVRLAFPLANAPALST